MKTAKVVLIILVTVAFTAAAIYFALSFFKPKPAGIYVSSNPQSNVYVNGIFEGKTPFQKTLPAQAITLKLVPDMADQNLFPFETRISLINGIQTVVRREFGISEDASSGDVISFEKETGSNTSLIVISTPDNARVFIDGLARGFAPYKASLIDPGNHQVTVRAEGYLDRVMTVSTKQGYRLTLFAKLAKSTEPSPEPSPTATPAPTVMVVILTTPTGYLRVRTEPGSKGEEIGQVKPGDKFPLLETDSATGWFKIRFEEPQPGLPNGISGWVSNQYAKEVETN